MKSRHYTYRGGRLFIEGVAVSELARRFGTPLYVYSRGTVEDAYHSYQSAFSEIPHLVCYSLKANSNLAIGAIIAKAGGGADIVSGGELVRAGKMGFEAPHIIFSGVGKTKDELAFAIQKKIRMINVESEEELRALNQVANSLRKPAPFSLRVNPDVRAGGHPHISTGTPKNKFGVYHKNIFPLYKWAKKQKYLRPVGIQSHIGSQITKVAPYKRALSVLLDLVSKLQDEGVRLEIIDLGGGLGVDYHNDSPDSPVELAKILVPQLRDRGLVLFLEPGRSMVAQSGVLLTKVLYRKDAAGKYFVIVDAAMNDLARPALYDAYHEIIPARQTSAKKVPVDVVGPVCESGDYLARERPLAIPSQNDLFAIMTAGAYGFSMSSQYNTRPRAAEVLVSGTHVDVVRRRETVSDLLKGESIPTSLQGETPRHQAVSR